MTTETKDTVSVDLHGQKLELPKEMAEKIIAARDADKARLRELNEKLGKLDAEAAAAIAKANKAEEDRLALEHMKKGEVDKAKEMLTKEYKDRESKLAAKARDKHLAALVAANPNVVKSAVSDIVEALKGRTSYNLDSEAVVVLNADGSPQMNSEGKPLEVDAFLGDWLDKRPHYLLDKTPKGSGGEGTKGNTSGKVKTAAQIEELSPMEKAKFFADGGQLAASN